MVTENDVIEMVMSDPSIRRGSKSIIIGDIVDAGIDDWIDTDVSSILEDYSSGFKEHTEVIIKAKKVLNMHDHPELEIESIAGNLSNKTDFDKMYLNSTNNMLDFMCSYVKVYTIVKDLRSER